MKAIAVGNEVDTKADLAQRAGELRPNVVRIAALGIDRGRQIGDVGFAVVGGFRRQILPVTARSVRHPDRSAQRFFGWIQLAACLIFLRSGFVR